MREQLLGETPAARRKRSQQQRSRLTIVANRLPIYYDIHHQCQPSPGGLAEVMRSVSKTRISTWIGWAGREVSGENNTSGAPKTNQQHNANWVEIFIDKTEEDLYYKGFANEYLWPLFHGSIRESTWEDSHYKCYRALNQRFAIKAAENTERRALVWVHDYHLMLVPRLLKTLRPDLRIGFFLHIPFPDETTFASAPVAGELIEGMLGADLIGFQTHENTHKFLQAARNVSGAKICKEDIKVNTENKSTNSCVQTFPVGIDAEKWSQLADCSRAMNDDLLLRQKLGSPRLILLGVDRLDYTKGIVEKINAVGELMLANQLDPSSSIFIQILQRSRQGTRYYTDLETSIDKATRDMNARLGFEDQPRIKLLKETLTPAELASYYLCADILIATPRCDGMNIVCKEYVACRHDMQGSLILSENTGASKQMHSAWLVDPDNQDTIKNAIMLAAMATASEKERRMQDLRDNVFKHNADFWADSFLQKLEELSIEE